MISINVREAKTNLSSLLKQVEQGEEIQILRRGKPVAMLAPIPKDPVSLPPMAKFRDQIKIKGIPASETLAKMREETRY
jgi:prevent-host-death family protein